MGSYLSGRTSGAPIVEDALRLDMADLTKRELVRGGQRNRGTLLWTQDGKLIALAQYQSDLTDPVGGRLDFQYILPASGTAVVQRRAQFHLTTTRPRYGGLRWWFLCPLTGRRVRVLYLPPGTAQFASRQAGRLGYRSQRQTRTDRIINKAVAARQVLGVDSVDLLVMPSCPKPKGMHWHTYQQRVMDIARLRLALWATAPL